MTVNEQPDPLVSVDVVLMTLQGDDLSVFLPRRDSDPYAGALALPRGRIRIDKDAGLEATARRILSEKFGVVPVYLEQLGTFGGPFRDPGGWSLAVAYFALVPEATLATRPDVSAQLVRVAAVPALPFDHNEVVDAAVRRLRGKSGYSSLPFYLLPDEFTLPQLQRAYQGVTGQTQDPAAFRRKMLERGMVVAVPDQKNRDSARPAQLYRPGSKGLVLMKLPV